MSKRPGGALSTRPLHFIWMADCSGSMTGDKIQSLNYAIHNAIKPMQDVADENPYADVLVRAVKFSTGAQWHISQPTPVANFTWTNLSAGGVTDMGKALTMVAEQLKIPPMSDRALPPVLVMISDGQPTDDFETGLSALMDLPWGKKSVRLAIAIGEDADYEVLQRFIGHSEIPPFRADNPEQLVRCIKWVSTAVLKAVSSPVSQSANSGSSVTNIPIPRLADSGPASADILW